MEKIADGFYRAGETHFVGGGDYISAKASMTIDVIDGDYLDTQVELSGSFCVAGSQRLEFVKALDELISKYRI